MPLLSTLTASISKSGWTMPHSPNFAVDGTSLSQNCLSFCDGPHGPRCELLEGIDCFVHFVSTASDMQYVFTSVL